ncbi:MAG: hypothetical protein QOC66_1120 [Pseudonocardiales bacterium]|jgi:hypothetical protein|nr:hypothetical protein [Pseudonocardiales bacterium]
MENYLVLADEDLAAQTVELLPARETLLTINVANVVGVNISLAINAASLGASANSLAGQQLTSFQH